MPRLTLFLACTLLAPFATTGAQNATPIEVAPGERIRVDAPALLDVPIVGRLSAFGGDSLVMRASDGHATMWLPLSLVKRVQVSEGKARLAYAFALGAAGVVVGGAAGSALTPGDPLDRTAGFVVGVILGAPIGAVTGAIVAPERWWTALQVDSATTPRGVLRLAIDEGADVRFALRTDTAVVERAMSGGVISDTLRLLPRGGAPSRAIALRDLSRLEISGGDDKRRGMLIGAGIVGGATAIFAGADAFQGNISAGDAVSSVAGNALLGALIGYVFAPRGWERLPLPAR